MDNELNARMGEHLNKLQAIYDEKILQLIQQNDYIRIIIKLIQIQQLIQVQHLIQLQNLIQLQQLINQCPFCLISNII